MQVVIEIFLELINYLVGRKEEQAKKIFWAQRFIFLGASLTLFAIVFLILSILNGGIVPETWCAVGPFLIVGIPSLVIGIIRLNNQ